MESEQGGSRRKIDVIVEIKIVEIKRVAIREKLQWTVKNGH